MEGWSRGYWAGISSLPLPQAEPREHRAGSRVLAFGSPHLQGQGPGAVTQCLLPPAATPLRPPHPGDKTAGEISITSDMQMIPL